MIVKVSQVSILFQTRCEVGIAWDNAKKICIKYMEKIRPRKPREIYVQNEIYRPTTTSWLDIGQGQYVTCNDFGGSRTDAGTKLLTSRNGKYSISRALLRPTFITLTSENNQITLVLYIYCVDLPAAIVYNKCNEKNLSLNTI